ncbi:hypothetical protein ABCS02_10215 [Microbacterium sp. X-17]|uniref:hypothetical protein n=1 Tax=Microbacterium sp. X-17 TaxID=3144404 RepID=UPI0031F4C6CB
MVATVAVALLLTGCSGDYVETTGQGQGDSATVAQAKVGLLSIICATKRYSDDLTRVARSEMSLDTFRALQSEAADGSNLFTRSAAEIRQPSTPWPAGTEADAEAVAGFYDRGAAAFDHLAHFNTLSEAGAVVTELESLSDPATADALGRLEAAVGISPDLAGECAAHGT